MGLKFKTVKIRSNRNDWSKELMADVTNAAVEGVKEELENELMDVECEVHKQNTRGTITVLGKQHGKRIAFQFSNFCCSDFKNSIEIK